MKAEVDLHATVVAFLGEIWKYILIEYSDKERERERVSNKFGATLFASKAKRMAIYTRFVTVAAAPHKEENGHWQSLGLSGPVTEAPRETISCKTFRTSEDDGWLRTLFLPKAVVLTLKGGKNPVLRPIFGNTSSMQSAFWQKNVPLLHCRISNSNEDQTGQADQAQDQAFQSRPLSQVLVFHGFPSYIHHCTLFTPNRRKNMGHASKRTLQKSKVTGERCRLSAGTTPTPPPTTTTLIDHCHHYKSYQIYAFPTLLMAAHRLCTSEASEIPACSPSRWPITSRTSAASALDESGVFVSRFTWVWVPARVRSLFFGCSLYPSGSPNDFFTPLTSSLCPTHGASFEAPLQQVQGKPRARLESQLWMTSMEYAFKVLRSKKHAFGAAGIQNLISTIIHPVLQKWLVGVLGWCQIRIGCPHPSPHTTTQASLRHMQNLTVI